MKLDEAMRSKHVAVIGAGVIGLGVAQQLAQTGHTVLLLDNSSTAIGRARESIARTISLQRFLAETDSASTDPVDTILNRITFATQMDQLATASFAIENVTENLAVKAEVYKMMDEVCDHGCIFAANTSAIPITAIASMTKRPGKVVGLHFMNPVAKKSSVEVIYGHHTTSETRASTRALLKSMRMTGIEVGDAPGFVSNRVLMPMINEAIFIVHEHVATAETVDSIFRQCMGHAMGPLETADLIGLDTILNSLQVLYDNYQDPKFRPCILLKQMVASGRCGRKTGGGFYVYEDKVT